MPSQRKVPARCIKSMYYNLCNQWLSCQYWPRHLNSERHKGQIECAECISEPSISNSSGYFVNILSLVTNKQEKSTQTETLLVDVGVIFKQQAEKVSFCEIQSVYEERYQAEQTRINSYFTASKKIPKNRCLFQPID